MRRTSFLLLLVFTVSCGFTDAVVDIDSKRIATNVNDAQRYVRVGNKTNENVTAENEERGLDAVKKLFEKTPGLSKIKALVGKNPDPSKMKAVVEKNPQLSKLKTMVGNDPIKLTGADIKTVQAIAAKDPKKGLKLKHVLMILGALGMVVTGGMAIGIVAK